jgi:hypothetical protein
LSPVRLRMAVSDGHVVAGWVRRSRSGFGWADFVDAPLAEADEAYRLDITLDGRPVRSLTLSENSYVYTAAERATDGGGAQVEFAVSQLSAAVGPGPAATARIDLPN